jgi:hypothetical protein
LLESRKESSRGPLWVSGRQRCAQCA